MKFYEVNKDHTDTVRDDLVYMGTLAEAHAIAKEVDEPTYRPNVRITEVEVPTSKTYVCALLNMALGRFDRSPDNVITERGHVWGITARGGLREITD